MIQIKCLRRIYGGVRLRLAIRLLILPIILSVIDFSMTLLFQPTEYWEGDRTVLIEGNPIARLVLMLHPFLIVPAIAAWYVLMFPLIFQTPARIGLRVIAIHVLGHMIAISGWLIRMRDDWVWFLTPLLVVVTILVIGLLMPFRRQWNASKPVHD